MRFFLPDSQDLVDPSFNFERETRSNMRVRHRDDQYAHEVFTSRAYDGILVSKGIVDGFGSASGRYTLAQRHRLLRVGAPEFFRVNDKQVPIMGDCGAFSYVREPMPPYTVEEVLEFYEECQFQLGISVDHAILAYQPKLDSLKNIPDAIPKEHLRRQELTLQLAKEFITSHKQMGCNFLPVGVAQAWSPHSYREAVRALQKMGYTYIALGGMVPLKSNEILTCLEAIKDVLAANTRLHLLGVTRIEHVAAFSSYGVGSFDSTSPLMQAFKDEKDNYYAPDRTYIAIRVPQVEGNPQLQRRIASGQVSQERARHLEKACLNALRCYDKGEFSLDETLDAVLAYDSFCESGKDHREAYRTVLADRPWKHCPCDICVRLGYQVILFRGAERNRRRGLHNVWVFYRKLQKELNLKSSESVQTEAASN
jgi:hypothetical protein